MLNLLPALEKLGTNFEEITNDLFDVAQATEPDFVFITLFKKSHDQNCSVQIQVINVV